MAKTTADIRVEIEQALDIVRKGLSLHRGGVELVDFYEGTGTVSVRLQGACIGCPLSDMTVKAGIEDLLKSVIPEVREVIAVSDSSQSKHRHDA
ncbi:NifU family protein [Patescibacteria group bacterium]|jgi:Fe-S cluster biogenesis protein NfuA|uniref:NifU family protein n=1 Tax=candidate division WWE3 bacterium TaxID=2053526 RepID=A0A928TR46_UNCKA|nr:NifU family protein [candidate division WWE3 bacterium]MCL4732520.1 NifU family protein [Patescibacteria group bacterium]